MNDKFDGVTPASSKPVRGPPFRAGCVRSAAAARVQSRKKKQQPFCRCEPLLADYKLSTAADTHAPLVCAPEAVRCRVQCVHAHTSSRVCKRAVLVAMLFAHNTQLGL